MSANNKRRRVEGVESPKPMSAISALAARRRAAAANSPQPEDASDPDERPEGSNKNFFSPLQKSSPTNPGNKPLVKPKAQRTPASPATYQTAEVPTQAPKAPDAKTDDAFPRLVQYSSFRLSKRNHRVKAGGVVELRLENGERFLVLGAFGVKVLHGEVTIAGASLRPSDKIYWVQSTHCHAVPVLRTAENSGLELHPDPNFQGIRRLERLSPLFRKLWSEVPNKTFQILCTSEDAPKRSIIQELVSPAAWNKKLAGLLSSAAKGLAMATFVCGPKSAGKSTFSRLLTNRFLTESTLSQTVKSVSVLDLDPGQPEFAPAGTLSLSRVTRPTLGPPFFHPGNNSAASEIIRCHTLASVSPASDPELFMESATDLFETYKRQSTDEPLIINTPGWILGTGLDLLVQLIKKIQPCEVIYMSEEGPLDTVEALQAATSKTLTTLPSQQSEFISRTAAHLRAMQMMSYFHVDSSKQSSCEAEMQSQRLHWNSFPLSAQPPMVIKFSGDSMGILGILSYDYQAPPELLASTINGMVLAAVEIEDPRAFRSLVSEGSSAPKLSTTPEGLPFIPNHNDISLDPSYSSTIGLVLVRGVDAKSKSLQVITPIIPGQVARIKSLKRDIVLLHGKFDAPSWAYMEDLHERAGQDEANDGGIEVVDEDTSEDSSDEEPENVERVGDIKSVPWVEVLRGNEKRPVGSRVWRVRRDLGRNTGE